MSLAVEMEPLPLATDTDGSVRVGGTRVTLDTIVEAFNEGLTAEEIAQQYPVIELADIYAVIGYYLRHVDHVRAYLQERTRVATALRTRIETELPAVGFRERLLSRQRARS